MHLSVFHTYEKEKRYKRKKFFYVGHLRLQGEKGKTSSLKCAFKIAMLDVTAKRQWYGTEQNYIQLMDTIRMMMFRCMC